MPDLIANFGLSDTALGHLTSAVQFGFISGTLAFAVLTIADRFSPSRVFLVSAVCGALFNFCVIWDGNTAGSLLLLRFLTGFSLAGIYPVGMKVAADYFDKGLGKSLGFLVGALVLGTALPHLLKELTEEFPWTYVLIATSSLAVFGGLLMVILVADGPFRRPGKGVDLSAFYRLFGKREFRSAAFGYFGHMWELYAFWAFVPLMLQLFANLHPDASFNISLLTFLIIGAGGVACVLGAYVSQSFGTKRTAFLALLFSGLCCLLAPLMFSIASAWLFITFLIFWGMVVIADSPLFSTMVAMNAPGELKGTALTVVNCIGFSITIVSIQALNMLQQLTDSSGIFTLLALGPILGLVALRRS